MKRQFQFNEYTTDSDIVVDLGISTTGGHGHVIKDDHNGACILYCPVTKHEFKHIITAPNKLALLCRGCGEAVK
jgi:hypothetical protein